MRRSPTQTKVGNIITVIIKFSRSRRRTYKALGNYRDHTCDVTEQDLKKKQKRSITRRTARAAKRYATTEDSSTGHTVKPSSACF